MSIDFDLIREENIKKFGTETAHLQLLANLYSDRTHFIYEILQNAEDAGANEVEFHLRDDRLEVLHDGRPFDDDDVRGICAIGKGTKAEDVTKIGRFGVGFKSVYAFTESPSIHSDNNHFCVRDYVRPHVVPPRDVRPNWTLIVLPFDSSASPEAAVEEIDRGLTTLDDRSLLFLQSVETVTYYDHVNDWQLSHERTRSAENGLAEVAITISRDALEGDEGRQDLQTWLVWSRPLDEVGISGRNIEIAVSVTLEEASGELVPVRLVAPPLVAFFPTEKESHLGVLLQAPFRTTPARDNIPPLDPTNQDIVAEAAGLLIEVVESLRDRGQLNADILAALPLDPEHFPADSMLRPLHVAVVDAFCERPLIPVVGGGHRAASGVAIGRNESVRSLLSDQQLDELLGGSFDWVSPSVGDPFRAFLRDVCDVEDHTMSALVELMEADFLARQPAEWIGHLYTSMGDAPELTRRPRYGQPGAALRAPIIRTANGAHQLPHDDEGHPTAYLPSAVETELPQVDPDVLQSEESVLFLKKSLGFAEPDVIAELSEIVVPRYDGLDVDDLESDEYLHHVGLVLEALNEDASRTKRLREVLDDVPFVMGVPADGEDRRLCTVDELVFPNDETLLLLGDGPGRMFLDVTYFEDLDQDLRPLAKLHEVRPSFRTPDWGDKVFVYSDHGSHKRGVNRFDPETRCPDVQHAILNPTEERARWVWNELAIPSKHLLVGMVETATRQDYSNAQRREEVSPLGRLLRDNRWIPISGGFVRPADVELEDLPSSFTRDQQLAEALGLRSSWVRELSGKTEIPLDVLQRLSSDSDFLREVAALAEERAATTTRDEAVEVEEEAYDSARFREELESAMTRDGAAGGERAPSSGGTVRNPRLRRSRVAEQIAEDQSEEAPSARRFTVVPKRRWEAKRNETRDELAILYGGRCQVCSSGFLKADGTPYFEGLYLVSYTRATWIDRLGNVLSLCATCCAKFQHGQVDASSMLRSLQSWRAVSEGGDGNLTFEIELAGEPEVIRFKERHLVDLQALMGVSDDER